MARLCDRWNRAATGRSRPGRSRPGRSCDVRGAGTAGGVGGSPDAGGDAGRGAGAGAGRVSGVASCCPHAPSTPRPTSSDASLHRTRTIVDPSMTPTQGGPACGAGSHSSRGASLRRAKMDATASRRAHGRHRLRSVRQRDAVRRARARSRRGGDRRSGQHVLHGPRHRPRHGVRRRIGSRAASSARCSAPASASSPASRCSRPSTRTATRKRRVAFAAPYPGKIVPIDLSRIGGTLIAQRDAFLCAARGVSLGIAFQRKLGTGFFGGEGFIMEKLDGDGMVFVHAGGTILERQLALGEVLRVDTGCVVAYQPTVDFDIQYVGKVKTALFGGEGLFFATLRGPGPRVAAVAAVLAPREPRVRGGAAGRRTRPRRRRTSAAWSAAPRVGGLLGGIGGLRRRRRLISRGATSIARAPERLRPPACARPRGRCGCRARCATTAARPRRGDACAGRRRSGCAAATRRRVRRAPCCAAPSPDAR